MSAHSELKILGFTDTQVNAAIERWGSDTMARLNQCRKSATCAMADRHTHGCRENRPGSAFKQILSEQDLPVVGAPSTSTLAFVRIDFDEDATCPDAAEDAFIRTSGDSLCSACGKPYWKHPGSPDHLTEDGTGALYSWLKVLCDGTLVKL